MADNKELDLAWDFVTQTNRTLFLTGKAGTGKTTFLHKLKQKSNKRMVIVAPTGVAAINAKGVTIHSFFQLPFGPILPDADVANNSAFNRKFSKTKIDIIKSLDLLVIDEISMVRADLLDGIDKTLRRFKNKQLVFGGVQLLMIGDLQQLSPVVKDNDWRLLQPYYKNAFFFSSRAFQECYPITVELKHIYRQENPLFITILNEIRNNNLTASSAAELNKRYDPDFNPKTEEGYISLTTHNSKANTINQSKLKALKSKSYNYEAVITGNFPEHSYPNDINLELKVGAQVMFIKNDSTTDKRFFNGKIGRVLDLSKSKVTVRCPGDTEDIITGVETWENIKYNLDAKTKAIAEEKIGSFSQIPLRLAWSITIHKSQGLTFERAIIDAEDAFAHGQTYVALSRCKSLEGLVLKSKIESKQIISDHNVISFNKRAEENAPDSDQLLQSKGQYQLDLIAEIFEFYSVLHPINRLLDIYYKNRNRIEGVVEPLLLKLKEDATHLIKVSTSFKTQLKTLQTEGETPENNKAIQERFTKAIEYFKVQIEDLLVVPLKSFAFTTDNKSVEQDLNKTLDVLEAFLTVKTFYFKEIKTTFTTKHFLDLRVKAVFLLNKGAKKERKSVIDGTVHVDLFEDLRILRNQIAERNSLVHFQVFSQKSLYAMCESLPTSLEELKAIEGMGKTRVEKYGTAIISVIRSYCEDNDIETTDANNLLENDSKKRKKGDTKLISLDLFKSGKSIDQIALERELNVNTVFGHLADFISTGEVAVTDLMSKAHYKELLALIPAKTFDNLSDLKHQLDDKFSYGELRLVLNQLESD
ncbi:helix-turn-helix domain-containing protein [Bizionia paragorgiae]|uniref:helix-turn-helix domain-containing protein n=1 Tax=Bizionia paragorgiae TaxID=283786 RepID=UPI00299DA842|nr:helix-turn-helix domain-containing protein [Bizionia paragorgiae]MDX1271311.1 helix-turn-helix domain-containing protein [Bizionia paragorgiae]